MKIFLKKKMVCNVTQAIVDSQNNAIFSWSLAASDDGVPFLLMRAPANSNKKIPIQLTFAGLKKPLNVEYIDCDATICLAQLAVGPILTAQIEHAGVVHIAFQLSNGKKIALDAPFAGLKEAVSSIK